MAKPKKPRFIANAFISDIAETAGVVPDVIPLLPAAPFVGRDGRGPFEFDFTNLLAAFLANAADLPVDFGHATLSEAERSEPTPVAGWIHEIVDAEDGSVWGKVRWTDRAKSHIAAQEFRYISPVFYAPKGQIERLLGAGLVAMPNLYMPSLNSEETSVEDSSQEETSPVETQTTETPETVVEQTPETSPEAAVVAQESVPEAGSPTTTETPAETPVEAPIASEAIVETVVETPAEPVVETVPAETTPEVPSMLTQITEALGLAADATVEAVLEALTALRASAESAASVAAAAVADLSTPSVDEIVAAHGAEIEAMTARFTEATGQVEAMRVQIETAQADVVAMTARAETAEQKLAALETAAHTALVEAAVSGAIKSGRFPPAKREALTSMATRDLEAFNALVEGSPILAVVAGPVAIHTDETEHGLTAEQIAHCQKLGIDPAIYAKHIKL